MLGFHRSVYVCTLSRVWLRDPLRCRPPGSSVQGIILARYLEWVAIFFSREFSQPRDRTQVCLHSCTAGRFFTSEPLGKPISQVKKNAFLTLFPHAILCLKRSILRNKLWWAMRSGYCKIMWYRSGHRTSKMNHHQLYQRLIFIQSRWSCVYGGIGMESFIMSFFQKTN